MYCIYFRNQEKLAKLKAAAANRLGGKGAPRRKVKKPAKSAGVDDKKLQAALKKLNPTSIPSVDEVNMFQDDGKVLHFIAPKGTFLFHFYR
jgi:nascent polypeptide-associated complex subunit beta